MKRFLCSLIIALFMATPSFSLERLTITLGLLEKLNSTEERFSQQWQKAFAPNNELLKVNVKFYPTLTALQMALNAGEIKHMVLPEPSAEYVMRQTGEYDPVLVLRSQGMGLAFGFREEDRELRDKFNAALEAMRDGLILSALEGMYIASPGNDDPQPVKFADFPGGMTIRAAVTGDLPPIDFIAPDGTPAGFNTAVLAEIGRRIGANIQLVNIDAGARSAALASGRADVVFWYEVVKGAEIQPDIPEGVIVSEPYYEWEKFIHLRKKQKQQSSSSWSWNISLPDFMSLYLGGE
ncbi:MAG: transporter substrate-binding domain-containing protein [Synergistaceae bacterium]|nr:transporter substrate-binding domain-containing protein [Synergistaceae bacterium]